MRAVGFILLFVGLAQLAFGSSAFAQLRGTTPNGGVIPLPQQQSGLAVGSAPQTANPQAAPAISLPDAGYILGSQDVLQVDVLGRSDFTAKTTVGTDGKIQLPLLGAIQASDRTILQLRDEIRDALQKGGFFNKPIVEVQIISYASRYVTVLGAVGTPGLIPVDRPYRLSEILARVGGARESGADYVVLRTKDGEKNYAIKDLATGDIKLDPDVQPGDKIFVPNADMFFIKGQVKAPGGYGLLPHMTLQMALARGGGLTDLGSDSHIKIFRKNGGTVAHKDLNVEVLPDDVIDVGEGWF
jgi:polysaccharide export outer membrane protein